MYRSKIFWVCVVSLLVLLPGSGCKKSGKNQSEIKLRIVYQGGEPVANATLKFYKKTPDKGNEAWFFPGSTSNDGTFTGKGGPLGDVVLVVSNPFSSMAGKEDMMNQFMKQKGSMDMAQMDKGKLKDKFNKKNLPQIEFKPPSFKPIPKKYQDQKTSDLVYTLNDGMNDLGTIELKKEK